MRPRRAAASALVAWLLCLAGGGPAAAQAPETVFGKTVASLRVTVAGKPIQDDQVNSLLLIHLGDVLTMQAARETVQHVMGLRRYLDVRVEAQPEGTGVRVDVILVPLQDVRQLVFRGTLGQADSALKEVVTERFGQTPAIGRSADVARTVEEHLNSEGFLKATVRPAPMTDAELDAGELIFDVEAGPRARIRELRLSGDPQSDVDGLRKALAVAEDDVYKPADLKRKIDTYLAAIRKGGYYQAKVEQSATVTADRDAVDLSLIVTRGPLVVVEFSGDPLPVAVRTDLVPIEKEGTIDQDLLEDSERRIKDYLTARGYRDAAAQSTVSTAGGRLHVLFDVRRGPLYRMADDIAIVGGDAATAAAVKPLVKMGRGQPFVQANLDADVSALRTAYLQRGFSDAIITSSQTVTDAAEGERAVTVTLTITEGVQMTVTSVTFAGRQQLTEEQVRGVVTVREGMPYYQPTLDADRDRLEAAYLNRGFRRVRVRVDVPPPDSGPGVNVRFVIQEGPQVMVDRILVVGNDRVGEPTIRRELDIRSGEPLGDEAVRQSQRKLAALGLFRRVTIAEVQHGQETRSDVLITVEETEATSLGYGGGLEFQKVETVEFAPRGFIELGRRNLWGKNRSVNLYSRVSFRHQTSTATPVEPVNVSLNNLEYRVIGSYREPRFAGGPGDFQVSAVFDQGSRTSFRYKHRSARVDYSERLKSGWRALGTYSFESNEIFDDQIDPVDRPLIDRVFPQVRLSKMSATMVRDLRDDALDPSTGMLVSFSGDLALRPLGSEVGLAKTFAQFFMFKQLPTARRIVMAGGVRLGVGSGFPRDVAVTDGNGNPVPGPDGQPQTVTVQDLPASERFFAGGDTTVRGFQADRLGRPATFDRGGTPIGGHAELILNLEARVSLWKDLGVVGFIDGGNVFSDVNDFGFNKLRGSMGFGIRYKSPVGPLRIDFGFKLGALQTFGTYRESRTALHISIGQAF